MLHLNWWEAEIRCQDGVGMPIDITELPAKIRRQIATQITKGQKCGSFDNYVDEDKLSELDPELVLGLLEVSKMHLDNIANRNGGTDEQAQSESKID